MWSFLARHKSAPCWPVNLLKWWIEFRDLSSSDSGTVGNISGEIWGAVLLKNWIAAQREGVETSSTNRIQALDKAHLSRPSSCIGAPVPDMKLEHVMEVGFSAVSSRRIRAYPRNEFDFQVSAPGILIEKQKVNFNPPSSSEFSVDPPRSDSNVCVSI